MNAEKFGPGSVLILFHLKNNRNVVPNIGDSKGGMKLRLGTLASGDLGLAGITSISSCAGIWVTVFRIKHDWLVEKTQHRQVN